MFLMILQEKQMLEVFKSFASMQPVGSGLAIHCSLTLEQVIRLSELLESRGGGLEYLNLAGGNIGDEGARYIALSLEKLKNLKHLGLAKNNIGPKGAEHLARTLRCNTSIISLDLSGNCIGEGSKEGADSIVDALKHNAVQRLTLCANNLEDEVIDGIERALQYKEDMQNLEIQHKGEMPTLQPGCSKVYSSMTRNSCSNVIEPFLAVFVGLAVGILIECPPAPSQLVRGIIIGILAFGYSRGWVDRVAFRQKAYMHDANVR